MDHKNEFGGAETPAPHGARVPSVDINATITHNTQMFAYTMEPAMCSNDIQHMQKSVDEFLSSRVCSDDTGIVDDFSSQYINKEPVTTSQENFNSMQQEPPPKDGTMAHQSGSDPLEDVSNSEYRKSVLEELKHMEFPSKRPLFPPALDKALNGQINRDIASKDEVKAAAAGFIHKYENTLYSYQQRIAHTLKPVSKALLLCDDVCMDLRAMKKCLTILLSILVELNMEISHDRRKNVLCHYGKPEELLKSFEDVGCSELFGEQFLSKNGLSRPRRNDVPRLKVSSLTRPRRDPKANKRPLKSVAGASNAKKRKEKKNGASPKSMTICVQVEQETENILDINGDNNEDAGVAQIIIRNGTEESVNVDGIMDGNGQLLNNADGQNDDVVEDILNGFTSNIIVDVGNLNVIKKEEERVRKAVEDKPANCSYCAEVFERRALLIRHMKSAHPEQLPKCNVCNRLFGFESSLKSHMVEKHSELKIECPECGKLFRDENRLQAHQFVHTGEKSFSCSVCKKKCLTKAHLDQHLLSHGRQSQRFFCEQCDKVFAKRTNYRHHIKLHTGEKPFECEMCQKRFATKQYLQIHQRCHSTEKPFVCATCGRGFQFNHVLVDHIRTHTGETPYVCEICGMSFKVKRTLKRHMKTHVDERPHVCEVCGRGFKVKATLSEHMKTHSTERPYQCEQCGQAYKRSVELRRHACPSKCIQIMPETVMDNPPSTSHQSIQSTQVTLAPAITPVALPITQTTDGTHGATTIILQPVNVNPQQHFGMFLNL